VAGALGGRPGFFLAGAAPLSRASAAARSWAWVDFGCTAGTFFKGVSVFAEFNDFLASGDRLKTGWNGYGGFFGFFNL
jgi:hypothetical protein